MRCFVVCHGTLKSGGVFLGRGKCGKGRDQARTMLLYHLVPISLLLSKNRNNNNIKQTHVNNEIIGNRMA